MLRSFTDRVLGGVAGGLAAALRVNSGVIRALWLLLTLISGGAFALTYVLLWWLTPPQSPTERRQRGLPVIAALALFVITAAAWAARDQGLLRTPTGADLFWPGAALVLAIVLFMRQLGGRGRRPAAADGSDRS